MLLQKTSQLETNLISVERIKEYTEGIPREREAPNPNTHPPSHWPNKGTISFNNVKLRYREGLDLVLKGVSFEVCQHQKIGIVGRTGAGKSTIAQSLFRTIELASGSICIDAIDIFFIGVERSSQISLYHTTRSRSIFWNNEGEI